MDPYPGSGAFLTPGSQIPNPYFWKLNDNFLGKKSIILCKLAIIEVTDYQEILGSVLLSLVSSF